MLTVLEPEGLYPDTRLEQEILGPGVRILQGNAKASLAELPDSLLAEVDGLMTLRMALSPAPTPLQITLGFVLTLATTALFVWAGGRIFRVAYLSLISRAPLMSGWSPPFS